MNVQIKETDIGPYKVGRRVCKVHYRIYVPSNVGPNHQDVIPDPTDAVKRSYPSSGRLRLPLIRGTCEAPTSQESDRL